MEHIITSNNIVTYDPEKKKKSNYIYRDLLLWLFFLIVLPTLFFSLYYIVRVQHPHLVEKLHVNGQHENVDDTNYLNEPENLNFEELLHSDFNQLDQSYRRINFNEITKSRPLMKISLKKYQNAVCNDGSVANYYLRLSNTNSKSWLIVVEGGYFCYNALTCQQRYLHSHNFTSSKRNKSFKYGKGILSSLDTENKYWSDVNVVNIPYCSSDLWIGDRLSSCQEKNCSGEHFNFKGQQILDNVFTDLLNEQGMTDANLVLMAGISSGGIGTLLNANKLKAKIEAAAPYAQLKVIIDSSWLLELPYSYLCNFLDNQSQDSCIINKIFMNSINFWQANLPSVCENLPNIWDCFLPHKIIPKLKVPVFIVQSLYDESQLLEQLRTINSQHNTRNGINLVKEIIQKMNSRLRNSLKLISTSMNGYFVPSCITHMILNRNDFNKFQISGSYLEDEIYSWAKNNKCSNKIENCRWPDCHRTCPSIPNPANNGLSVNLLEYFSYFGAVNLDHLARKFRIRKTYLKSIEKYNKIMEIIMR